MVRWTNGFSVLAIALLVGCSGEPDQPARNESSDSNVVTEIDVDQPNFEGNRDNATAETAGSPADVSRDGDVPARFQGQWRVNRKSCDNPRDTMGVTITADRLLFYESEGKVRAVRDTGQDSLAVSADYTGEGDSWSRWSTLKLTDRDELLIDDVRRVRCR